MNVDSGAPTHPHTYPPTRPVPQNAYMPLPGAHPGQAISRYFTKYVVFAGRASRSEYWWVALFHALVFIAGGVLIAVFQATAGTNRYGRVSEGTTLGADLVIQALLIYSLVTILPNIALGIRRLHDLNMAGWFILLGLVPGAGSIALLVLTVLPSNPLGQRFDQPTFPGTPRPERFDKITFS
jgi:uncharacterized membrane protein YhaH (DUF805 family)